MPHEDYSETICCHNLSHLNIAASARNTLELFYHAALDTENIRKLSSFYGSSLFSEISGKQKALYEVHKVDDAIW